MIMKTNSINPIYTFISFLPVKTVSCIVVYTHSYEMTQFVRFDEKWTEFRLISTYVGCSKIHILYDYLAWGLN